MLLFLWLNARPNSVFVVVGHCQSSFYGCCWAMSTYTGSILISFGQPHLKSMCYIGKDPAKFHVSFGGLAPIQNLYLLFCVHVYPNPMLVAVCPNPCKFQYYCGCGSASNQLLCLWWPKARSNSMRSVVDQYPAKYCHCCGGNSVT